MTAVRLLDLSPSCFEGTIPGVLATCGPDGSVNVTWLSKVFRVDERCVALSCQFFRKTVENLDHDPRAQILLSHPTLPEQWRLDVRFVRRETSGPVFDGMKRSIEMIAALTGTRDVFALRSADLFEVMMITRVAVEVPPALVAPGPQRDPLTALARIAEGISACRGLDALVQSGLSLMSLHLGLDTVSLYLAEESERSLYALASHGYPESGVGARIDYGVGIVGACAQQRIAFRIADMARELRYGGAVREQLERVAGGREREVPLPGLENAGSLLAVPLVLDGELFGVLSSESTRMLAYDERDVLALSTAGQLLAQAIARVREEESEREPGSTSTLPTRAGVLRVRYHEADDSVFLDDEYLIRGLPGRILWLLLSLREREGRHTFSNRELRLHPLLKLPAYKDNLETRLLMLQRRLHDKAAPLQLGRPQRGRLSLQCALHIELAVGS